MFLVGKDAIVNSKVATKPRLLLVDDHELMLDGLRRILEKDFELVGTRVDGRAALEAFATIKPDVLLLDVTLPELNGIEVARRLALSPHRAKIVFVTMHADSSYVREAFLAGASGYILKRAASSELIQGIQAVLEGRYFVSRSISMKDSDRVYDMHQNPVELLGGALTPRQREVIQLVAEGKAVKEISALLHISVRTVEFHKSRIMEELGLYTTAELTRYAIEHGISASG
jgi:DNA-binding NarL/FixJ family response regulator